MPSKPGENVIKQLMSETVFAATKHKQMYKINTKHEIFLAVSCVSIFKSDF